MLKIRLQRIGRRNDPSFRVVVTEHTRGPKSGDFLERVGSYNPKTKETNLNGERIQYWISVGAQASGRVHNMLVKAGIVKGATVNVLPKKTPIVKESTEEEAASDDQAEESTETTEGDAEAKAEPAEAKEETKEEEEPAKDDSVEPEAKSE